MENQIKKSLITLRKIASLTSESRINTLRGDIDEYTESGLINKLQRVIFDSRNNALEMLKKKYDEIREHTKYIFESGKFTDMLISIKQNLISSREGLELYKNNPRYIDDKAVKSMIEHLLNDEIPAQVKNIDRYIEEQS